MAPGSLDPNGWFDGMLLGREPWRGIVNIFIRYHKWSGNGSPVCKFAAGKSSSLGKFHQGAIPSAKAGV
jgi:hypothetical protein